METQITEIRVSLKNEAVVSPTTRKRALTNFQIDENDHVSVV